MIRRPRSTKPDSRIATLGRALSPIPMYPWMNAALAYLGVPIFATQFFVVVHDEDIDEGVVKLQQAGFTVSKADRELFPEILESLEDPEQYMADLYASWASVNKVSKVFDYPDWKTQVFVVPNSFACIPDQVVYPDMNDDQDFDTYDNIRYPLEKVLIESFCRCTLNETSSSFNEWRAHLLDSISIMLRYLDIENDILDNCADSKVVEWFSENYGRGRETKHGPLDLRISKRIGSKRELPVDSRGRLLPHDQDTNQKLAK